MPDLYEKHLPPPEVALELPPEELALFVLRFLNDPAGESSSFRNRYSFTLMSTTQYGGSVGKDKISMALAEAWAWLEREGLIVPRPGTQGDWVEVSRRGKKLTAEVDFEAYKRGNLLRRDSLAAILEQKVWPIFIRGDYDVAVFQAFKLVEVRVRELSGFPDSDVGVALMGKAFNPRKGPLADPTLQPAEREALAALFTGAIGLFKNPGSHRAVKYEAAEAAEAIYLANTLLRLLARAEARLKARP